MPTTCAVASCPNTSRNVKDREITFHKFSSETSDPFRAKIRKLWIKNVQLYRKDPINPRTARVCSVHFDSNCWEMSAVSSISERTHKKKLLWKAVPQLLLKLEPEES